MTQFHSKGVKMRETATMATLLQLKMYREQLPIVVKEAEGGGGESEQEQAGLLNTPEEWMKTQFPMMLHSGLALTCGAGCQLRLQPPNWRS